jgi:hypothetical protein
LLIEFQRFYPELIDRCFIVNTPIFFEDFYEAELKPYISERTATKIIITGENTHKELLEKIDQDKLPKTYGGQCDCEATCVYSDKGPWADGENKINFQNRQITDMGIQGAVEEFKLQEDDED